MTDEQKNSLLRLKEYLDNATEEELQKDLDNIKEWSNIGPTWNEYLNFFKNNNYDGRN